MSFLSSGVPVKPMKTALGIIAFITRCSLPLCVRWHSSTKTKTSPTVWLGWASSSLMKASKSSTSLRPNLWTSEQSRRGLAWPSWLIRSRPLLVRLIGSPASVKTRSICLSSSSRSVMMATRALGLFSRIHLASSTMTMLLPLPCVCQMMPPFFSRDMLLRGLDAEILVHARQLLHAAVEEHEVVHQLDQPILVGTS